MPTFTIKTAHIEKMKQLGCYDKWLANMKAQWGKFASATETLNSDATLIHLILNCFSWNDSNEGEAYWSDLWNHKIYHAT